MKRYVDVNGLKSEITAVLEMSRTVRDERSKCNSSNDLINHVNGYIQALQYVLDVISAEQMLRGSICKGCAHHVNASIDEVTRAIFSELETEITAALVSNYRAKAERLKHSDIDLTDEIVSYCDGKIHALRGISDFIEEIKMKYIEE